MWFTSKRTSIERLTEPLPRAEVLRRARVAVLDDETPEMLQDLRAQGLAITHVRSTEDQQFQAVADGTYDLLLLDYGGIGPRFGPDEGLDVLRYLKRVNPGLRILAFTGRTFDASKADFFRLCDAVVKKDAGIRETLELLESHLSEVLTSNYQFVTLCNVLGLTADQRDQLEKELSKAVSENSNRDRSLNLARRFAKAGSGKVIEALVTKAIEFGIAALAAGG
jgi:DNA-binding response OmpR family regulator